MGKKIMAVDDAPDTLVLIKAVLEPEGFKVETFESPQEALVALKKNSKPDLVLLDMRMPVISGLDFCDIIRKDENLKDLKIVFFTASVRLDPSLAKKHKVLGFITKPFDNKGLVKEINKYLKM